MPAFVFSNLDFFSYLLLGAQEPEAQGSILGLRTEQAQMHVKKCYDLKDFPYLVFLSSSSEMAF